MFRETAKSIFKDAVVPAMGVGVLEARRAAVPSSSLNAYEQVKALYDVLIAQMKMNAGAVRAMSESAYKAWLQSELKKIDEIEIRVLSGEEESTIKLYKKAYESVVAIEAQEVRGYDSFSREEFYNLVRGYNFFQVYLSELIQRVKPVEPSILWLFSKEDPQYTKIWLWAKSESARINHLITISLIKGCPFLDQLGVPSLSDDFFTKSGNINVLATLKEFCAFVGTLIGSDNIYRFAVSRGLEQYGEALQDKERVLKILNYFHIYKNNPRLCSAMMNVLKVVIDFDERRQMIDCLLSKDHLHKVCEILNLQIQITPVITEEMINAAALEATRAQLISSHLPRITPPEIVKIINDYFPREKPLQNLVGLFASASASAALSSEEETELKAVAPGWR